MIARAQLCNQLRDAWVEVNLGFLEENISELRRKIAATGASGAPKIMAVIKADGYGHGSVAIAPTLLACGVNAFGVATLDEGIELRKHKITAPILVLGMVPHWCFEGALENNIQISIFNDEHLEAAGQLYDKMNERNKNGVFDFRAGESQGQSSYEKTGKKLMAQVKVDTGMNRIGIDVKDAAAFIERAKKSPAIDLKGVFTHFADVENEEIFVAQNERFKKLLAQIDTNGLEIHCSNSPAALNGGEPYDMVRLGIALYGLTPFSPQYDKNRTATKNLKQIIGLKGRITNINEIEAGEGVSYGHTFIAKNLTRVATIPIGYADGVSRSLSGKIKASLNGKIINQIGRITMDQMMFDITGNEAKTGDIITLLGEDGGNFFSIDNWARELNTINYELTCRLKVRLPRVYTR